MSDMQDLRGRARPVRQGSRPRDVTGRPLALADVDLDTLFSPRTVAVLGASDTPGRPTTVNWRMVRRWGDAHGATVHPVNPGRERVDGLTCFPSLDAVPGRIDVVVAVIADAFAAVAAAAQRGAAFVIVFSSGFAELGDEGAQAQDRLRGLLTGGLRMLGPNTNMNAFDAFRDDLEGPAIALISQSGHQGRPIYMLQENNVRVSHWAPTGNEADLELADFAAWFADHPDVGVIAAYIEGFRDGRTFMLAADRCVERDTPLVMVKVGRSDVGRGSAASHTGKLSGSDRVTDGVFRQLGVSRVDTLDQLADTATLLARAGRPRAPGVVVYSISGGTGAHLADLCAAAGLDVVTLSEGTQAALHQWIPSYLQVANPVDCGGHPAGDERGRKILDTIVGDPDVGLLICAITGPFPPLSDRLAHDLADVAEHAEIPVCVIWGSPVGCEPALRDVLYGSQRLVVFRSAANCIDAVRSWQAWHTFRAGYRSPFTAAPRRPSPAAGAARALLAGGGPLSEHRSKQLLEAYDIPTSTDVLVDGADEAVDAAGDIDGPVVMKACSPALLHKSDHGLVIADLSSPDEVRAAYERLAEAAERLAPGSMEGVLVCEQLRGGVEAVVGVSQDEVFGPTVMVGLGGVLVEALGDVAFRVPPFGREEAERMVRELRASALLAGVRGRPADVAALTDTVLRVQSMAMDLGDQLVELDINPLLVRRGGGGVVALDALAVGAQPS